jgi:8-amino-7-oxononanoate synthase
MALFDKFAKLAAAHRDLVGDAKDPFAATLEICSATEARLDGRSVILAGTNNYLGLTFDPECIAAAKTALEREGTGTTGSRMAGGTRSGHMALETELADFYGRRHCTIFSTGYLANLGVLSTLTGTGDVVLLDADCHASIYDGARMGGAEVIRFRHNDAQDLNKRLRRLGERAQNALILVEGLYSMQGDRAPLTEIAALKRTYGACLLVDEAHSLGVLGTHGRGLAEECGVETDVDFITGTFSKSLGATVGFCVSDRPELEVMRYASRAYVFTASPSSSVIASTRTALRILRSERSLRDRLWANAERLYAGLIDLGYRLGPEASPVLAVFLDSAEQAIGLWRELIEHGVYVNVVLPPAAPGDTALLRVSVSAAHSGAEIDAILSAFTELRPMAAA